MLKQIEEQFLPNQKRVTGKIIETVRNQKISYIDATIKVSEEIGVDIESINKYISPTIKTKLKEEALALNLIKNDSARLTL